MLRVYLDDSQDHPNPSLSLAAGYIAHEGMWDDEFGVAWNSALKDAGVEYFHATEFFSGNGVFGSHSIDP